MDDKLMQLLTEQLIFLGEFDAKTMEINTYIRWDEGINAFLLRTYDKLYMCYDINDFHYEIYDITAKHFDLMFDRFQPFAAKEI